MDIKVNLLFFRDLTDIIKLLHEGYLNRKVIAHCFDNWVRTWGYRVESLAWAKSLTPGFAIINHFYEMILPLRIDWCTDTWLELSHILLLSQAQRIRMTRRSSPLNFYIFVTIFIHIYQLKNKVTIKDTTFSQTNCCKVNTILIYLIWC